MCGAVSAMFVDSVDAKSSGKLCAFLSCITSIPKFALLRTSPHVGTILPLASTTDSVSYTHLTLPTKRIV